MSLALDEIRAQPRCWRRAAELAADPAVASALPRPGARVAVVGCGAMLHIAQAYAVLREDHGEGETDAYAAGEFMLTRKYDHVIALTRSGTSIEIIRLLQELPMTTYTTVITTSAEHPVIQHAHASVTLEFADERTVTQTRFATTALALLRADFDPLLPAAIAEAGHQVEHDDLMRRLAGHEQFTFLAGGWGVGLAHDAAFRLRAAARTWTEAYAESEFRHGPLGLLDKRTAVWFLGRAPDELAEAVDETGARVIESRCDPMAGLIGVQRFALMLAERRGLDPHRHRAAALSGCQA